MKTIAIFAPGMRRARPNYPTQSKTHTLSRGPAEKAEARTSSNEESARISSMFRAGRMPICIAFLFFSSGLLAGLQSTETFLPAVGRAPGQADAQFYTTVWATNLTGAISRTTERKR
jgi:hypothetical protein